MAQDILADDTYWQHLFLYFCAVDTGFEQDSACHHFTDLGLL